MAGLTDAVRHMLQGDFAQKSLAWTSRILFAILILALADTVVGGFSGDKPLRLVRGEADYLTAKLNRPVDVGTGFALETGPEKAAELLDYKTDALGLTLTFVEVAGRDWRALAVIDPNAPTGDYVLHVFRRGAPDPDKEPVLALRVFRDQAAANALAATFCERHLGFPPFLAILGILPPLALCFMFSFRLSGRRLRDLAALGIGPIYRLTRRKQHWELLMGLGSAHGVAPGATLLILDQQKHPVLEVEVDSVESDTSHAVLSLDSTIRPDYLVMLKAQPGNRAQA